MIRDDEIELRVCKGCDAPLPNAHGLLNYFNKNELICDDCYSQISPE